MPTAPQTAHVAPVEPAATGPRHRAWRVIGGLAAALVLLLTFMAYLSPHLAADLANRLWACF
jgi:hypothetical protein